MAQSIQPAVPSKASVTNSSDRYKFKYVGASTSLPVQKAKAKAEAEAMDLLQLPAHISPFHDASGVTLIAIDFENGSNTNPSVPSHFQVGLAVLDVDDINSIQADQAGNETAKQATHGAISTYNIVTGYPEYRQRASRRFLFGETVSLDRNDEIAAYIESLIPRDRRVFLVGHAIENELRALDSLQVDYSRFRMLDTLSITREMYPRACLSLRRVLLKLGCPYERLHSAGNDANFTLRALLLLAVQTPMDQSGLCPEKLAVMKAIALSALPGAEPVQPNVAVVWKAKKNKRKNSRKQQSKSWSIETQEKIRAERAAKRLALAHRDAFAIFFGI